MMMRPVDRLLDLNWRVIAAALIAAAILHILVTLAAPRLTTASAIERLDAALPLNKMQVLAPIAPNNQPLPFLGPDGRYAMCRFDTSAAPVGIKASLPEPGWTLALYSKDGDNFYVAAGQPGTRTDLSILLVTSDERFMGLTPEARGLSTDKQVSLPISAHHGVAVLRAPDRGPAYRAEVEAELKRASCAVERQ
jgi:uncharacterized membrane protein